MKRKPLSDLMGRHGPEELDDMLHDVEVNGEAYELTADAPDGRVVALVVPGDGLQWPAGQAALARADAALAEDDDLDDEPTGCDR